MNKKQKKMMDDRIKYLKGQDKNILVGIVLGLSASNGEALDMLVRYLKKKLKNN